MTVVEQIGLYRTARLTFPGRAGELQRQGASASMVRELGDSYAAYHRHLRDELARIGRPKPEDYTDRNAYFDAWARAQEIVLGEALLRTCAAYRRSGRPLDSPLDTSIPLLDENDRLVAAFPLDDQASGT